jgi:formamidopyrimidine-DNA glycosylase
VPELPEVETVRRGLERAVLGRRIKRALLRRRDFAVGERSKPASSAELLEGQSVASIERRGKQIAVIAGSGRVVVIHLGMSGQVLTLEAGAQPAQANHVHAEWHLADGARILFRDPRRFGGLWALSSRKALSRRWEELGPDALNAAGSDLHEAAGTSARTIKAVLLDQAVLAGVGNIYADEALFAAGISPRRRARSLSQEEWGLLAHQIRVVLAEAIQAKGSTLRDYVGTSGEEGRAQTLHRVYGRGGEPCFICGAVLRSLTLAQRTTVYCPTCQGRSTSRVSPDSPQRLRSALRFSPRAARGGCSSLSL